MRATVSTLGLRLGLPMAILALAVIANGCAAEAEAVPEAPPVTTTQAPTSTTRPSDNPVAAFAIWVTAVDDYTATLDVPTIWDYYGTTDRLDLYRMLCGAFDEGTEPVDVVVALVDGWMASPVADLVLDADIDVAGVLVGAALESCEVASK